MAEGLLKALYSDKYDAFSAGISPTGVNPYAIQVMAELGIDISANRSKSVDEFRGRTFDYVVTVCDHAKETCPFFPGRTILHQRFTDPTVFSGKEGAILNGVRSVRDEIKRWIEQTFSIS
jgi:arsenate reductase